MFLGGNLVQKLKGAAKIVPRETLKKWTLNCDINVVLFGLIYLSILFGKLTLKNISMLKLWTEVAYEKFIKIWHPFSSVILEYLHRTILPKLVLKVFNS